MPGLWAYGVISYTYDISYMNYDIPMGYVPLASRLVGVDKVQAVVGRMQFRMLDN